MSVIFAMEYKTPSGMNIKEILFKLAHLQKEIDTIKDSLELSDDQLESEMSKWEKTSIEDTSKFLEINNL